MVNILLFLLTVATYSTLWIWDNGYAVGFRKRATVVALFSLLCLPFNINGYVLTVLGNAVGENGVYSIFSLYQKTDGDAFTLLGLAGYQNAGRNAGTGIGLAIYQRVGNERGSLTRTFGAFTALRAADIPSSSPGSN